MAIIIQGGDKQMGILSRRRFLHGLLGGAGAAALLAACGAPALSTQDDSQVATPGAVAGSATEAPAAGSGTVALSLMYNETEFSNDEIKAFTDSNPNISVERVPMADDAQFKAMLAAGTLPDVFRTEGRFIPSLATHGAILDISDYMKNSRTIKLSDLAPANSYYAYQGAIYGMPKDWSPDHSMFASNQVFKEAGIALPDPAQPLTYADIAELAPKLTKRNGDQTVQIGWLYEVGWFVRTIQRILAEQDQHLYKPDFSAIVLKDNRLAVDALKFFFDLSKEQATWSPIDPNPIGGADGFLKGQVGMISYGYWYSGMIATAKDSKVTDQVTMLPAPSWGGKKRIDPTVGAAGTAIAKATKHPEEAWKLFEYYSSGAPAQARAKSGWGVPALVSLYELMPNDTPFRQQVQTVLKDELKYADYTLEVNPYYEDSAFNTSWTTNLDQALRGKISFEQLVEGIEKDVNAAITTGRKAKL